MDHTEHWHIVGKHGENLLINEVFRTELGGLGHGLGHVLGQSHDFGHGLGFGHRHVRKHRTRVRTRT